ncbi:condensation domain-containing protein, partial [Flavitalea flava]
NRLLIVIHHLAVDGVSWRILLEDLERLIAGAGEQNGQVILGPKGSSYREWYGALAAYGESRRLLTQSDYWTTVVQQYQPLPVDKEDKRTVQLGDIEEYTERLNTHLTRQLVQDSGVAYHTEINDILLCALGLTLSEWSGTDRVVVGMEGHGREEIGAAVDTSRTVGWFTNLYPVWMEIQAELGPGDQLRNVKEQLRKVPDKGLGYGV